MKGYFIFAENSHIKLICDDVIAGTGVICEGKSLYKMNMCVVKPDEPAVVCLTSAVSPKSNQITGLA